MDYSKMIQLNSDIKEKEVELKKKKTDFEDTIKLEKAVLNDMTTKMTELKEEAILTLEKENVSSIKEGDYTIIKQLKITNVIDNTDSLCKSISENIDKVKDLGFEESQFDGLFVSELIVKDKKTVEDIIDKFSKVEGKLLDGVILKETKFISIREN